MYNDIEQNNNLNTENNTPAADTSNQSGSIDTNSQTANNQSSESTSFYGQGSYSYGDSTRYYDSPNFNTTAYSTTTKTEVKSEKKKKRAGKVAGVLVGAICFGIIAGAVGYGVNYGLKNLFGVEEKDNTDNNNKIQISAVVNSTGSDGEAIVMDAADAADAVMPAVVAVTSKIISEQYYMGYFPMGIRESEASGSGIIIGQNDSEVLIVTNNHVIEDNSGVSIRFIDDSIVTAVVKGTAPDIDIAVLAVDVDDISDETMGQIRVAMLGNSDNLRLGERVIAVGNALGLGQSVTQGGISAIGRSITVDDVTFENMIQTDAAINKGNSGGALINIRGEVIGINSAKSSATGVEGMGYAIPISSVIDVINELMNRETRELVDEKDRGYLGISGYAVDSEAQQRYGTPAGISVQYVEEGSAAEKAGIQQFDIITKFDGQKVGSVEELQSLLQYYEAGETVKITIAYMENRQYVEQELEITLGRTPQ